MSLLACLSSEAIQRGLLDPGARLDPETVFTLVRDMPYRRASNRRPETTIAEWRGTCSGKHYLLRELFAELGLPSRVMACTTVTPVEPELVPESLLPLYRAANGRFVDVHNYLVLELLEGEMIVDSTWPRVASRSGLPVNETFVLGQDQRLAAEPLQTWPVPQNRDPQEFKESLLGAHFSPAELEFREEVIRHLSEKTSEAV